MIAVRCLLFVVCGCVSGDACCLLFVVCSLLVVVLLFVVCMVCGVCCLLCVVWSVVAAGWLLCCWLSDVVYCLMVFDCWLFADCSLLDD